MDTSILDSRSRCYRNNCKIHTCIFGNQKFGLDERFDREREVDSRHCRTEEELGIPLLEVLEVLHLLLALVGDRIALPRHLHMLAFERRYAATVVVAGAVVGIVPEMPLFLSWKVEKPYYRRLKSYP